MSGTSNGRIIRIAVAGSLAVHLVFAAIVQSHPVQAKPEQRPMLLPITHIQLPPPSPPPKPSLPHPRAAIAQTRSRAIRPAIRTPRVQAPPNARGPVANVSGAEPSGDPGPIDASPGLVAATAAPALPAPTPKPACSSPDIPAKTLAARAPDEPEDAQDQGMTGTAKIQVNLDDQGNVTGASVYASSGYMELDRAALAAARESRYAPEEVACKNVAGSYLFTVDFR